MLLNKYKQYNYFQITRNMEIMSSLMKHYCCCIDCRKNILFYYCFKIFRSNIQDCFGDRRGVSAYFSAQFYIQLLHFFSFSHDGFHRFKAIFAIHNLFNDLTPWLDSTNLLQQTCITK